MKQVLLIGAGLSTQKLVPYLKSLISTEGIRLRVVDKALEVAQERMGEIMHEVFGALDITDKQALSLK